MLQVSTQIQTQAYDTYTHIRVYCIHVGMGIYDLCMRTCAHCLFAQSFLSKFSLKEKCPFLKPNWKIAVDHAPHDPKTEPDEQRSILFFLPQQMPATDHF